MVGGVAFKRTNNQPNNNPMDLHAKASGGMAGGLFFVPSIMVNIAFIIITIILFIITIIILSCVWFKFRKSGEALASKRVRPPTIYSTTRPPSSHTHTQTRRWTITRKLLTRIVS